MIENAGPMPFRLDVHIGAGRAGSSAIQDALQMRQDSLASAGATYLGVHLEHAPIRKYGWQVRSSEQLFKLHDDEARRQLTDVLTQSIAALRDRKHRRAVLSNERFLRRGSAVRNALIDLAAAGVEVWIVVYVRRHDVWAQSAYVQWGLKAKEKGPQLSFQEYIDRRPVDFAGAIAPWREAFPGRLLIRNVDAVGDAAVDFMSITGLPALEGPSVRANPSPSGAELALRVLFNEITPGKNRPAAAFSSALRISRRDFDRPIESILDGMPALADIERLILDTAEDRATVNQWLAAAGQPPLDVSHPTVRQAPVDPSKVLTVLAQLVMEQSVRLQALEESTQRGSPATPVPAAASEPEHQVALPMSSPSAAPVFIISTGRSGSTLIQRMLNCHPDLVVWGEHHGFLNGLGMAYRAMSGPRNLYPKTSAENDAPSILLPTLQDPAAAIEWANPWSLEEMRPQLRAFISGYFGGRLAPGQRWGFKEILYNNPQVLTLLRELYPEGRFVFVRRDPAEIARSKVASFIKEEGWSKLSDAERTQRVGKLLSDIQTHFETYSAFMANHPGVGMWLDFEALVANPFEVMAAVFAHTNLDPQRFDWDQGKAVMANVVNKTRHNESVASLVKAVASAQAPAA